MGLAAAGALSESCGMCSAGVAPAAVGGRIRLESLGPWGRGWIGGVLIPVMFVLLQPYIYLPLSSMGQQRID